MSSWLSNVSGPLLAQAGGADSLRWALYDGLALLGSWLLLKLLLAISHFLLKVLAVTGVLMLLLWLVLVYFHRN